LRHLGRFDRLNDPFRFLSLSKVVPELVEVTVLAP
jgi:hypothetical protein